MKKYLFLTDYQTGLIKNNGNQLTKVDDTVTGPYYRYPKKHYGKPFTTKNSISTQ